MGFIDKLKSWFASDDALLERNGISPETDQPAPSAREEKPQPTPDAAPASSAAINADTIYQELLAYGAEAGYITGKHNQESNEVLLASVKNQVVKMHEEILAYYKKKNLMPDEKLLNRLTIENMFYLAMGTAMLVKVKQTNLIAQGFFAKMLKKSGPELFYREISTMAGNKYGAEPVEQLHQHIQRAGYMLLTQVDSRPEARTLVIECAKAMYMYGLAVTIKRKE